MSYVVSVGFDAANHRYYVLSSDIPGLHIETETFEDFVEAVRDATPELVGDHAAGSKIRFESDNVDQGDPSPARGEGALIT